MAGTESISTTNSIQAIQSFCLAGSMVVVVVAKVLCSDFKSDWKKIYFIYSPTILHCTSRASAMGASKRGETFQIWNVKMTRHKLRLIFEVVVKLRNANLSFDLTTTAHIYNSLLEIFLLEFKVYCNLTQLKGIKDKSNLC